MTVRRTSGWIVARRTAIEISPATTMATIVRPGKRKSSMVGTLRGGQNASMCGGLRNEPACALNCMISVRPRISPSARWISRYFSTVGSSGSEDTARATPMAARSRHRLGRITNQPIHSISSTGANSR